ncbi:MAG: hypothetical protein ACP5II_07595 [Infirmifilum sp.]|jgi:uncharacterized protein (DUF983 family)|uniref:Uncharacterized protein n=1 Tax=Infirmifilum uzonense TaxID=1550241 RepID=A0A0F7FIA8_9CREN|nr:hypothetical protein [Infirmifilum uzonense]AKG38929.1 hypothetical protein MA03_06255 [Infirmifilum uzonense]
MSDVISQVKRQRLPAYITLLVGGFILIIALLYLYFKTNMDTYLSGVILLLLIEGYVAWSLYKLISIKSEKKYLVTHLRCSNCGYEMEREFREGDSLFKDVETCPKCKVGKLVVEAIFLRVEHT